MVGSIRFKHNNSRWEFISRYLIYSLALAVMCVWFWNLVEGLIWKIYLGILYALLIYMHYDSMKMIAQKMKNKHIMGFKETIKKFFKNEHNKSD